jgi:hypothetical protein
VPNQVPVVQGLEYLNKENESTDKVRLQRIFNQEYSRTHFAKHKNG